MSALSSDDESETRSNDHSEFDDKRTESGTRPISLERKYQKLSFVSHNRRSSLAEVVPSSLTLKRTGSAPSQIENGRGLQSGAGPSSPLAQSFQDEGAAEREESETNSESMLRRNSSLMGKYGVKMVASRNRGSNGSIGSGLSEEIRRHAANTPDISSPPSPEQSIRRSRPDIDLTPTMARRRSRETSPSLGVSPRNTSFNTSPTLQRHNESGPSPNGTKTQHSPSPSRSVSISRSSNDIASVLRERRRQASVPFNNMVNDKPPSLESRPAPRRQHSRHATRLSSLAMSSPAAEQSNTISAALDSYPWHLHKASEPQTPWETPSRDILMTPTTEEWTSYGGHVGSRLHLGRGKSSTSLATLSSGKGVRVKGRKSDSNSNSGTESDSDTSSTSMTDCEENERPQKGRIDWQANVQPHPGVSRFKSWSSFGLGPATPGPFDVQTPPPITSNNKSATSGYVAPSQVATAGSGLALLTTSRSSLDGDEEAIPLIPDGPIDPRKYSARTGARDIHSFSVQGEAGRGAYGTVVKAREYAKDQLTEKGPEIIIKYIIKQRILADCWKKHKILGPIPVEIHVLDHLRRIPYVEMLPPLPATPSPKARPLATGHPNVCSVVDFFEDSEHYYLCMPCFGNGKDLFDHVEGYPDGLPTGQIQSILTQIASAVAFLHLHGIVHRDIKDENVTLDEIGRVQLIDFGSAAYVKEGRKFDTFSGTLDFAAPEVLHGERYDGKETDIWALGVLAYVLVCGECPFWNSEEAVLGLAETTRAAVALRNKVQPVGSQRKRDEVMDDAVDLVRQCLQVDAGDRPTAAQVCRHWFIMRQFQSQYTHTAWRGKRGWLKSD